ncbi:MAG TPA: PDZ domain-containing protein [Pyrinomonadaceae bacterium]|jgi:S1-C subfamily serine protease|nr:PDZ domain-containing protein [Pyrinomonadaceae bacterium]
MRASKKINLFKRAVPVVVIIGMLAVQAAAQVKTEAPSPSPELRKTITATTVNRVILENKPAAPQVVTILHTLNGLKVFRLLVRSKEQVEAIERLDQAFKIAGEVHVNVIAGLALDDGHTIAAWLPEAEAEMPPRAIGFGPRAPAPPRVPAPSPPVKGQPSPTMAPMAPLPGLPSVNFVGNLLEPADLRVITRDGKRILGHYVGLDGLTGLSLITLTNGSVPQTVDSKEEAIVVGQQLRVIGPQPAPGSETGTRTPMYIRIGETEAIVVNVIRSPSGGIARVKIKSAKFSPANIGGIAINDKGETLGIVDGVEGDAATIVPVALVRLAAKRVMARQASVPRPWLGIRGEPIGSLSLEKIQRVGWELQRARALADKRQGILLTSVAPGSPAALAKLKPGDVILSVNNGFIRNAEEFSWLLDEADRESPTLFTIARPGNDVSESMEIKLSESPDPFFGLKKFEEHIPKYKPVAEGLETIALKPKVASRFFGSTGGLLVVSVQPSTDAYKAGLRAGDVIESIDGQPVYSGGTTMMLPKTPGARSSCIVVRNKHKMTLTFQYSTNHYSNTP